MDPVISPPVDDTTVLRAPAYVTSKAAGAVLALDPVAQNWLTTDDRGARAIGSYYGDEFRSPNRLRLAPGRTLVARQEIREGMTGG